MSTAASARTASIELAGVAGRPRSRSARLNDVMKATGSRSCMRALSGSHSGSHAALVDVGAKLPNVCLVLQEAAERGGDHGVVECVDVESHERVGPVERLGDTGRLHQTLPPDCLNEAR